MTLNVTSNILVSTNAAGNQANDSSRYAAFSPDGSHIIFNTTATNLLPGATIFESIYLKNLTTGALTRLTEDQAGTAANGGVFAASFSPTGDQVAFWSYADNLVAGDTNGVMDVFIKDINTGAVTLVSQTATGIQPNSDASNHAWNNDGTEIAFTSEATNLIPGITNGDVQIYRKDLATGALSLISTNASGVAGNDHSFHGTFSPDGTLYAFSSYANNLVAGDTNNEQDIFVKNLVTGDVTRVSTSTSGGQANDDNGTPLFSPDGTKIAFISFADNLAPGDTNGRQDIYIKDLITGETSLVSANISGEVGETYSNIAAWSPDGTKIAFVSRSTNFVSATNNFSSNLYVKDLETGEVSLVSRAHDGDVTNGSSIIPVWSPDGTQIMFQSGANNIVTGDAGGHEDIFIATLHDDGITRATNEDDDFSGTDGNDIIHALTGNDTVDAGEGDDIVKGGSGDDTVYGGHGNDSLNTHAGNDTVYGGTGNDSIHGGDDNDVIYGGGWSDFLYGDDGDDTLYGGTGTNWLIGGAGADKFVLDEDAFDGHADKAKDFDETEGDTLYLEGILVGFDPLTDAITDFVSSTESGGHTTVAIDRDGTGGTYAAEDVLILKNYTGFDVQTQYDDGGIIVDSGIAAA